MLSIFLIPAALDRDAGPDDRFAGTRLGGIRRHGGALFRRLRDCLLGRSRSHIRCCMAVDQHVSAMQPGGNMEGKEVRFGIAHSALFATVTTDASCGAVNACTTASRRWVAWCR